ncbi:porin [Pseudomaricurvus sp. HS19]|uniref:porin n=1 Tax=Pseudomaricurvus sp. HS19 TaxID=2692626 RepID=UPI00136DD695|nr:porin [Pseudomaricurvus sp. HS19]MYM62677.1 hypothetical protein [Pseudomaricurvus sp. HS19]
MTSACLGAEPVTNLSAGVWGTYQYYPGDDSNTNTGGEFTGEALIIYADGEAAPPERWLYSAEMRFGPGSFTDPDNNSTGDEFTLHKAWVGWRFSDTYTLRVGKSQVPFGWKTINFWPGDILLAGFGDQMDVGFKFSAVQEQFNYDLAYYVQDDWGGTSTDTVDDNGHWGSSTTFRKVQTWVGNLRWQATDQHALGISLQSGQLQDLTGTPDKPTSGSHEAAVLYYEGNINNLFLKASWITQSRELPTAYWQAALLPEEIENDRYAFEIGYNIGDWSLYLDASAAKPNTDGNDADRVTAVAPGLSYDYGPGWIYVEYLWQDGYVDRNGQVGEGDFEALYVSLDFYL